MYEDSITAFLKISRSHGSTCLLTIDIPSKRIDILVGTNFFLVCAPNTTSIDRSWPYGSITQLLCPTFCIRREERALCSFVPLAS